MKKSPFLLMCFSSFALAQAEVGVSFQSFSVSDVLSVYQTAKDWQGHLRKGDYAASFTQAEMYAAYGALSVYGFSRRDYRIKFSNDTAVAYYSDKNDISPSDAKEYEIFLDVFRHETNGVGIAYAFSPHDTLTLTPRINTFRSSRLMDGQLVGNAYRAADGKVGAELDLFYFYDEEKIFDRPDVIPANGEGYGVDLQGVWNLNEKWLMEVSLLDVWARIEWRDAPYTRARSRAPLSDSDDPFEYYKQAAIGGEEGYKDFTQQLPLRIDGVVKRKFDAFSGLLKAWGEEGEMYWAPGVAKQMGVVDVTTVFEVITRAVGVSVEGEYGYFSLLANSFDVQDSDILKMDVGVVISY